MTSTHSKFLNEASRRTKLPVVICPHGSESYLTAATLHEIERIKINRKSLAVERPVEVASFAS